MRVRPDSISSTSPWVTRSDGNWRNRCASVFVTLLIFSANAHSQITRQEALGRVYPGATIRAERVFLTGDQLKKAAQVAGVEVPSPLVARYVATKDGNVVGRAYVDTHVVRTKRESLLICLDETGKVKRTEVTAFLEPPEYRAPEAWYAQYRGKALNEDLNLHRSIRPAAGATLTAMAATRAVRRVLAIDQVLTGGAEAERKP